MGQWRDTVSHPLNAGKNARPLHTLVPTYQNNKLYQLTCPLDHRLQKKFRFHDSDVSIRKTQNYSVAINCF